MTHTCKQCKEDSEEGAMVQFEQDWVCAKCKTLYVQMLKEGVDELDVHDILEENGTRLSRLRRTVIRTYGIVYLLIAVFRFLLKFNPIWSRALRLLHIAGD